MFRRPGVEKCSEGLELEKCSEGLELEKCSEGLELEKCSEGLELEKCSEGLELEKCSEGLVSLISSTQKQQRRQTQKQLKQVHTSTVNIVMLKQCDVACALNRKSPTLWLQVSA